MVTPKSVQCHTGLTHHFLIFDIRALWRSGLSARVPECQKLKNGGLDQYGLERFGRLIFATVRKNAGLKGLKLYYEAVFVFLLTVKSEFVIIQ